MKKTNPDKLFFYPHTNFFFSVMVANNDFLCIFVLLNQFQYEKNPN